MPSNIGLYKLFIWDDVQLLQFVRKRRLQDFLSRFFCFCFVNFDQNVCKIVLLFVHHVNYSSVGIILLFCPEQQNDDEHITINVYHNHNCHSND